MTLLPTLRRSGVALLALLAAVTVIATGCGGGTQAQTYRPARLIVFGDERSALVDDGNHNAWKYSVNGINPTTNERDCTQLPNWVQTLATSYNLVFAECNPGGFVNPGALMRAQPGARIEDPVTGLGQQISVQLTQGLGVGDLVTVMIGSNDLVDLFNRVQNGQLSQTDAVSEAQRLGGVTAGWVNYLLSLNTRLILVTLPDLGSTPFALNAEQLVAGSRALLSALTSAYNAYLRTGVDAGKYDGRNYGLVLADDIVAGIVSNPTVYLTSPSDITDALCVTPLMTCTNDPSNLTTATGANTSSYLWADDLHAGPIVQSQMGSAAAARAQTNPF